MAYVLFVNAGTSKIGISPSIITIKQEKYGLFSVIDAIWGLDISKIIRSCFGMLLYTWNFMLLYLDFETWSSCPIRRGTDVYLDAAKPLLLTYAFDDGPVQVHDFLKSDVLPDDFYMAILSPGHTYIAHNSFFDKMVTRKLLGLQTDIYSWKCTMAQALAHGLPGGLEPLGAVLGIPQDEAKIADGKRLIRKFCCGPEILKNDPEWQLFIDYARNDISAMRACHKRMPNWNYSGDELRLWHIDQLINNRGFAVDTQLAERAIESLKKEKDKLDDAIWIQTCGSVTAATQRDKLLTYLCEREGCFLPDLTAPTLQEALDDESLPEHVKEILRIRLAAAKTSTSKFKRMLESTGRNSRLRGTLQFAGASRTARWSGRIFQPQNLPRPNMKLGDIRNVVELIRNGQPEMVGLFAPIGQACMNVLRGLIVAEDGSELMVSDYSAIEGRANAWLAGEDWKVKAFKDGTDLYCLIYERSFNLPAGSVTEKDPRRQIGKVMELAMGYGGGVGAFLNMATVYNLDLDEIGRQVQPEEKSLKAWEHAILDDTTFGLSKEIYCACDTLKIRYRKANPAIVQSWWQYEDAVRRVIEAKDTTLKISVGPIVFDCSETCMRIKLSSGRFLCYMFPKIGRLKKKRGKEDPDEQEFNAKGDISYMAWRNKAWSRTKTYGGKLCIAEGTPILIDVGWMPIESYVSSMRLWDGNSWVYGGRLIDNGESPVMEYSGVRMTGDHDVLTKNGWRTAALAQSEGLDRADVRLPDSSPLYTQQGWKDLLACSVRMRQPIGSSRQRANQDRQTPITEELWLQNKNIDRRRKHDARDDGASSICGVAQHERQVPTADAPSVEELRGAGYTGMHCLAVIFRRILVRYAKRISAWCNARTARQQRGIFQRELRLENAAQTSKQSAQQCFDSDALGLADSRASVPQNGNESNNRSRTYETWMADRTVARVYDIENVGPQHRFIAKGKNGEHLIVHNCENIVQAVSRDLLGFALLNMDTAGFPVVLHIHDEIIAEVNTQKNLTFEQFNTIMQTRPQWAAGFPLEAKGYTSRRYEKR